MYFLKVACEIYGNKSFIMSTLITRVRDLFEFLDLVSMFLARLVHMVRLWIRLEFMALIQWVFTLWIYIFLSIPWSLVPAVWTPRSARHFRLISTDKFLPLPWTCLTQFMHRCSVTLSCVAPLKMSKNCSALTRPPPWVKEWAFRRAGGEKKASNLDGFNDLKMLLKALLKPRNQNVPDILLLPWPQFAV